jgi:hypothetical protein
MNVRDMHCTVLARRRSRKLRRYQRAACADCGIRTTPQTRRGKVRDGSWEWYMVHDHVWAQAGMTDGFLCIGCLERRLDRVPSAERFHGHHVGA